MVSSDLKVNSKLCKSCPFRLNNQGYYIDNELVSKVVERTLFKGHQICHSTEGKNRKPKTRCKGSFDHNMEIYKRLKLDHLVK